MSTPTPPAAAGTRTRLHGLDALRAAALLLGIVLHSLMPFVPDLTWLVSDERRSPVAAIGLYVIHLFRMPMFLLLAGYFARMSLHRRGTGPFLADRLQRIGLPLLAFWPIAVLPLGLLAVLNFQLHDIPPPTPPAGADAGVSAMIGPGQLWFLQVLLECYLIMIGLRWLALRLLGETRCVAVVDRAAGLLSGPVGLVLAMVPYAITLLLQDGAGTGIREPTTFLPEPRGLIAYFAAFAVGWCFHARADALARVTRGRWVQLLIAIAATAAGLPMSEAPRIPDALVIVVIAIAGWAWVFALLGTAVAHLDAERPAVRYLADASYWMYLLHLPVLLALEIPLVEAGLPIPVKLLITWTAAFALLVLGYHLLVRSTWIGRWLNGRRHRRTRMPFTRPHPDLSASQVARATGDADNSGS